MDRVEIMNVQVSEAVVLLYQKLTASGNWGLRPVSDDASNEAVVHAIVSALEQRLSLV